MRCWKQGAESGAWGVTSDNMSSVRQKHVWVDFCNRTMLCQFTLSPLPPQACGPRHRAQGPDLGRVVCELKRAAKGTLISNDLDSLANAADLLGGFSFMDDLVKEDRLKSALPRTPKEDINRKYDWRTLYKYDSNFGDDLRQAQKDGYIFAADVGTIYHLNKKRKEE